MNDHDISMDQIPETRHNNPAGYGSDREYLKVNRGEKKFTHIQPVNNNTPTSAPEIKLYRRRKGTDAKPWFVVRLFESRIEFYDSMEKKSDHQKSENHNSKVRSIGDTYMQ
jgi:hypothetical protein